MPFTPPPVESEEKVEFTPPSLSSFEPPPLESEEKPKRKLTREQIKAEIEAKSTPTGSALPYQALGALGDYLVEPLSRMPAELISLPGRIGNVVLGKNYFLEAKPGQPIVPELLKPLPELESDLQGLRNSRLGQFIFTPEAPSQLAGLAKGVEDLARGLTSPEVALTMGAAAPQSAIPKAVQAAFAAQMAQGTPEAYREFGRATVEGTLGEAFRAGTGALGSSAMIAHISGKGVGSEAKLSQPTPEAEFLLEPSTRVVVQPQERPIAAVIQVKDTGEVFTGGIHGEAYLKALEAGKVKSVSDVNQDLFLTNEGRLVDRETADKEFGSREASDMLKQKFKYEPELADELAAKLNKPQEVAEAPITLATGKEPLGAPEVPSPRTETPAVEQGELSRNVAGTEPPVPATPPAVDVTSAQSATNVKQPLQAERVKLKGSPQTYTVLERPKPTEIEVQNNEQPVRIRNERTGEEQVVIESQLQAVKGKQPKPNMAGPGSTVPSDVGAAKSDVTQLAESLSTMTSKTKPESAGLRERASDLRASVSDSLNAVKGVFRNTLESLKAPPKFDNIDKAIGRWSRELQESGRDAYMAWKKITKALPDQRRRDAIGAYVDMGGDAAKMEAASKGLPERYARTYRNALKLTPEERVLAENIRNYFDSRLETAKEAGILEDGVENYIRRIYERESEWKEAALAALRTGKPDFAKKRVFETDAEAAREGYKPIQDFAQRVLVYDQELNRSLADRAFVKRLMDNTMPDGRPMIDVAGLGIPVEGDGGALLIKPQFKPNGGDTPANSRSDYKPFNHPAFRKWKWVSEDVEGKPVLVQGDVLVHPQAYERMLTLLEASRISPNTRKLLKYSSAVKQTMLDLSGFHQVQIAVHALEHRIFPSKKFGNLVDIDLKNETQGKLVDHGLVIFDEGGFEAFGEGLHSSSLLSKVPGIGPLADAYHNWLFKEFIPTVKMSMALHALERNKKVYPKLNEDQVLRLTAEQSNAAFGGLNYKLLGKSKTFIDRLRLTFLAPDFLWARGKFAGQALTPYGREQLTALMLGAATLYIAARIANQGISGNPRMEPENAFNVVIDGHSYGLRTVQGDILHLLQKPGQFWYHRLNPAIMRPLMEAVTGRDYFGNQLTLGDILINELKTPIPISLRGLVEGKNQTVMESGLNAFGITSRRFSDVTTAYKLATEWREKNKVKEVPGEFLYNPDKDPLHGLKVSLQYEDSNKAVEEIQKLLKDGKYSKGDLIKHFNRYASSPFTGSIATDKKFVESLSKENRQTVEEARKHKQKIRQDFLNALNLAQRGM